MTLPEVLLWRALRVAPGIRFRKQYAAGDYVLDFFCARANLAIEVDGFAHDTGERAGNDARRDSWLADRRIDTVRVPARDVLRDPAGVAEAIVLLVTDRLRRFGKTPPSGLRPATSPLSFDKLRIDGEELGSILPIDLRWGGGIAER